MVPFVRSPFVAARSRPSSWERAFVPEHYCTLLAADWDSLLAACIAYTQGIQGECTVPVPSVGHTALVAVAAVFVADVGRTDSVVDFDYGRQD